jgi:hypothetical protein
MLGMEVGGVRAAEPLLFDHNSLRLQFVLMQIRFCALYWKPVENNSREMHWEDAHSFQLGLLPLSPSDSLTSTLLS